MALLGINDFDMFLFFSRLFCASSSDSIFIFDFDLVSNPQFWLVDFNPIRRPPIYDWSNLLLGVAPTNHSDFNPKFIEA